MQACDTRFRHSFLNIRSENRPLTKHGIGFGLWKEGREGGNKPEANCLLTHVGGEAEAERGGSTVAPSVTTQEIGIGLHFLLPIALCTHLRAGCGRGEHTLEHKARLVDHNALQ